jgi:hypothetical protein
MEPFMQLLYVKCKMYGLLLYSFALRHEIIYAHFL